MIRESVECVAGVLPVTNPAIALHDELVRRHGSTASVLTTYVATQVYLLEERRLAVGTVVAELAALRFFYLDLAIARLSRVDRMPPVNGWSTLRCSIRSSV